MEMAAISRGTISAGSLQDRRIAAALTRASSIQSRTRVQIKGFMMPTARSFRAFRTIQKSSPRLTRSISRRFNRSTRLTTTTTTPAALPDRMSNTFRISKTPKEDDVMRKFNNSSQDDASNENSDSNTSSDPASAMVDTVNAVLADIVDGQKFIKETGRTQPRPMKRRQLVVSLALGGLRGPLSEVESRLGSLRRCSSRLSRTPSGSGFAKTVHLVSQLSFDGSSSHGAAEMH